MDIVKLIEVARWCVKSDDCDGCPGFSDCPFVGRGAHQVVSICDYYENLLIKQSEFNDRANGQLIQDGKCVEIGRATEKAFEGIYAELLIHDIWPSGDNKGTERIASVAELLEWATQEGKAGDETTLYDKEHEKVKYCMACGAKFTQEDQG